MKLELQTLIEMGACKNQVEKFRAMFGDSVDVTVEMCQSVASEFDWEWAAKNLLPYPLDAGYSAKCAPLYADYSAKCAPLYADYSAKLAPLDADYRAKLAPLDADYSAKLAPLDADYSAKRAKLFASLFIAAQRGEGV